MTRDPRRGERLLTLAAALALDAAFGEPPVPFHPVVWIGRPVGPWLRRAPGPDRPLAQLAWGAALAAGVSLAAAGLALAAERGAARLPLPARIAVGAVLLKPALASRALLEAGNEVRGHLETDDLAAARSSLRNLVSRDPSALDGPLVAAAAIQSLSENASDSIAAPALAHLAAGLPGAWGYRAVNTLDAMVGYRGTHEWLGKPAARIDDLLNIVPSRFTAGAIAVAALPAGRAGAALDAAVRDHGRTASPNAGWPMAAMAGALGVRLEKQGHYVLGEALRPPAASDIAAAGRMLSRLTALAAASCLLTGALRMGRAAVSEAVRDERRAASPCVRRRRSPGPGEAPDAAGTEEPRRSRPVRRESRR